MDDRLFAIVLASELVAVNLRLPLVDEVCFPFEKDNVDDALLLSDLVNEFNFELDHKLPFYFILI
jgi:hypothetical protein